MNTAIFAIGLILFVSGLVVMVYSVEKVVVDSIYNPSDDPYGPYITKHTEVVHPYLMEGAILLASGVVIGGLGIYLVPKMEAEHPVETSEKLVEAQSKKMKQHNLRICLIPLMLTSLFDQS